MLQSAVGLRAASRFRTLELLATNPLPAGYYMLPAGYY